MAAVPTSRRMTPEPAPGVEETCCQGVPGIRSRSTTTVFTLRSSTGSRCSVFTRVDQLLKPVEHGRAGQLDRMSPAAFSTWERAFGKVNDTASQFCGWRMRERARTALTREVLDREYDENKKALSELAVDFGLPYRIVIESRARELGVTVTAGRHPLTFDDIWLREQYVIHLRNTRGSGRASGSAKVPSSEGWPSWGSHYARSSSAAVKR